MLLGQRSLADVSVWILIQLNFADLKLTGQTETNLFWLLCGCRVYCARDFVLGTWRVTQRPLTPERDLWGWVLFERCCRRQKVHWLRTLDLHVNQTPHKSRSVAQLGCLMFHWCFWALDCIRYSVLRWRIYWSVNPWLHMIAMIIDWVWSVPKTQEICDLIIRSVLAGQIRDGDR